MPKVAAIQMCSSDNIEENLKVAGNFIQKAANHGANLIVLPEMFAIMGMGVCYDLRFPELFRCLFNKGAEIIALPSAFTVQTGKAHFELLARARAVENFCYVIGACQGGTHVTGRKTFGHSLIIDPWGQILAKQDNTESCVIYAMIDIKKLHEVRKKIPIQQHQRIFFDSSKI